MEARGGNLRSQVPAVESLHIFSRLPWQTPQRFGDYVLLLEKSQHKKSVHFVNSLRHEFDMSS